MTSKKRSCDWRFAHVLFIDIVSYSRLSIDDQRAAIERLNNVVQSTEEFRKANAAHRLVKKSRQATAWRFAWATSGCAEAWLERASALDFVRRDALVSPFFRELSARAAARAGNADHAVALLTQLLSTPYGGVSYWDWHLTPAVLQLDPMFGSHPP